MNRKRKPLDDIAASFVYGENQPQSEPEPEQPAPTPRTKPKQKESNLMSQLMETPQKEPTVRLTVDMPESLHKRLSLLAARSGKKKADIVRMLLDDFLDESIE